MQGINDINSASKGQLKALPEYFFFLSFFLFFSLLFFFKERKESFFYLKARSLYTINSFNPSKRQPHCQSRNGPDGSPSSRALDIGTLNRLHELNDRARNNDSR